MTKCILEPKLEPLSELDAERTRAWRTVFPATKQRKEPRFPFCFQIQVRGLDRSFVHFEEHTNTADISKNGCRFSLQTPVTQGAFLSIAAQRDDGRFGTEQCAIYSVVWCRPEGDGFEVGVELVEGPNLWNITFPEFSIGGW